MASSPVTTDVVVHEGHDPDLDRVRTYIMVAVFLAVLTALEVSTYLLDKDLQHTWYFAVGLCVLMAIKFGFVTAFFMHLKFDKRVLTVVFYSGLILAVLVYLAVLGTFRFFSPASHMIRF
jgi:cytochrome c oxidase subunit 4